MYKGKEYENDKLAYYKGKEFTEVDLIEHTKKLEYMSKIIRIMYISILLLIHIGLVLLVYTENYIESILWYVASIIVIGLTYKAYKKTVEDKLYQSYISMYLGDKEKEVIPSEHVIKIDVENKEVEMKYREALFRIKGVEIDSRAIIEPKEAEVEFIENNVLLEKYSRFYNVRIIKHGDKELNMK